ncbi:GIR2 [Candida pseudojiufengensis]|uniref:GIR2 n=1 Tax=Candida pseudojiufengensis TaxID=497109 RepID=UPI002225519D|nr:GIR2 [Candida pseudojiufengensis]KAI5959788.1 GIR2 [Candida pseudojiufengensis]
MDHKEEQSQELEILQSIYPEELEILNESQSHFQIIVNLDLPSEKKHSLLLIVKYPPTYPEVIPELHIEVKENELDDDDFDQNDEDEDDEDDEDTKQTKLALNMAETIEFSKDDLNTLLSKLNEESEINIGLPSVFTLITYLKDEAESLFVNKLAQANKDYEQKRQERYKQEQLKFQGTKVTPENFAEWRAKFRKEMKFEEQDLKKFQDMHNGKMSGKEIFEKGLAGNLEGDDLVDGVEKISL